MNALALRLLVPALTALLVTGCSDGGDGDRNNRQARLEQIGDFESYTWEELPAGPRWEPRAGLQALELDGRFYILGGRTPRPPMMPNPVPGDSDIWSDVWISADGANWEELTTAPWNAVSGDDVKYDFDIIVTNPYDLRATPAIYTFGGDRETFDFNDPLNYLRIDDDVWRFSLPEGSR